MANVGGKHKLVSFVNLGKAHELMNALSAKITRLIKERIEQGPK